MAPSKLSNESLQPKIDRVLDRAPSPISCSSLPHLSPSAQSGGAVNKVRVKVNDKMLLVVLQSADGTIDWLAKESAT